MTDNTTAERMRRYRQNLTPEQRNRNAQRQRHARAAKRATQLVTSGALATLRQTLVDTLTELEKTDWTIYHRRDWLTLIDAIDTLTTEIGDR